MNIRPRHPRPVTGLPLLKMLVYGKGGSGKTFFAGSFHTDSRTGPSLHLNSGGNLTLVSYWPDPPYIVDINDWKELDMVYQYIAGGQNPAHPLHSQLEVAYGEVPMFKTLVVDTLSDLQHDYIRSLVNPGAKLGEFSKLKPPGIKHWQGIGMWTMSLLNAFVNLPINLVMILQEKQKLNLDAGYTYIQPALDGQAVSSAPAWFKLMGHMEMQVGIVNDETGKEITAYKPRIVWSSGSSDRWTKNQLAPDRPGLVGLGTDMTVPTATKILDILETYFSSLANKQKE